jgi:uracil-DNA glycosylase
MPEPKSLRNEATRTARHASIHQPHVVDLNGFVATLRSRKGAGYQIPFFDPFDGGVNARALLLMEAPGRMAIESGFVSRDNPDDTAKNTLELSLAAGLDRRDCILWNVCPWFVGTATSVAPVQPADIREAEGELRWLLNRLPQLQCVALIGRKAQRAITTVTAERPGLPIVIMPHPSPRFVNRRPENRAKVLEGFRSIARATAAKR